MEADERTGHGLLEAGGSLCPPVSQGTSESGWASPRLWGPYSQGTAPCNCLHGLSNWSQIASTEPEGRKKKRLSSTSKAAGLPSDTAWTRLQLSCAGRRPSNTDLLSQAAGLCFWPSRTAPRSLLKVFSTSAVQLRIKFGLGPEVSKHKATSALSFCNIPALRSCFVAFYHLVHPNCTRDQKLRKRGKFQGVRRPLYQIMHGPQNTADSLQF